MSIETPSNTPSSRELLDKLTRTVETRWNEFNDLIGLPEFAKNMKPEYREMKQNYDAITGELSTLSSDQALRANKQIEFRMQDFLSKVRAYLNGPDVESKYVSVLEKADTDITALQKEIYLQQAGQKLDKNKAELSNQTQSQLSTVALWPTLAVAWAESREVTPGSVRVPYRLASEAISSEAQQVVPSSPESAQVAPAQSTPSTPKTRHGNESSQKSNGFLDKMEYFGDVWETATKIKEKAGFFSAAAFFFGALFSKNKFAELAKKYGVDVPKMNDSDNKAPDEKSAPETPSVVSVSLIAMRKIHGEQIKKYSEEARKWGEAILTNPHFLNLPFMEYRAMMKIDVRPDGLLKQSTVAKRVKLHEQIDKDILPKLGLSPSKANYEAVMYALSVIYPYTNNKKNSSLQDAVYSKITPKETIRDVMSGSVVNDLSHAYQLAQLDLTDIPNIGQALQPGIFIENGEIKWEQSDQLRTQFSNQTLKSVLLKSSAPFPVTQLTQADIDKDGQLKWASLDELNKLVEFRKQLVDSLIGADWVYQLENSVLNKAAWGLILKQVVASEAKNMSYAQVLRYYAILGGNGDTSKQNGIQKFVSHGILTNLVDQSHNNEAIWRMTAINGILVRQQISASSAVSIPSDIKNIFQNVLGSTQDKVTGTIWEWLEKFWAMFKTAPIEATTIAGVAGLYAVFGKWLPARDGSIYTRYIKS